MISILEKYNYLLGLKKSGYSSFLKRRFTKEEVPVAMDQIRNVVKKTDAKVRVKPLKISPKGH